MGYKLFLDDERYPADINPLWIIARNYEDAKWYLETKGMPEHISFDHDLCGAFDGYDFAKYFCEWIIANDKQDDLISHFTFVVHSMNPIGASNIKYYMNNFYKAVLADTI